MQKGISTKDLAILPSGELESVAKKINRALNTALDQLGNRLQAERLPIQEITKATSMLLDKVLQIEVVRLAKLKLEDGGEGPRSPVALPPGVVEVLGAIKGELASRKKDAPEAPIPEAERDEALDPEPEAAPCAGGAAGAPELPRPEVPEGDDVRAGDVQGPADGRATA